MRIQGDDPSSTLKGPLAITGESGRRRTRFRSGSKHHSVVKTNSFARLPEWCWAWSEMFSTGEPKGGEQAGQYPGIEASIHKENRVPAGDRPCEESKRFFGYLQHPTEVLPQLIEAINGGCDLAIASCYTGRRAVSNWSLIRRAISRTAQPI